MRTGIPAGAVIALLGMATAARAAPPLSISIACEELSAEERAHVEAMVRADLLVRAAGATHAKFDCDPTWVTAELEFPSGSRVSHGEPKSSSRALIAEQLILLSDTLLAQVHGPPNERAENELPGTGRAANGSTASGTQNSPRSSDATGTGDPPTPSSASILVSPRTPSSASVRASSSPLPMPSSGSTAAESLQSEEIRTLEATQRMRLNRGRLSLRGGVVLRRGAEERAANRFQVSGGVQYEPLLKDSSGLLGPRLGFAAQLQERFAFRATAGVFWTVGGSEGFSLRDHRLGVGLEYSGTEHLTLGLSVLMTNMLVSAPDGTTKSHLWSSVEPAGQVDVGYRWRARRFVFELKPNVIVYAHSRVVRRDLARVLEVPAVLAGVSVQTSCMF